MATRRSAQFRLVVIIFMLLGLVAAACTSAPGETASAEPTPPVQVAGTGTPEPESTPRGLIAAQPNYAGTIAPAPAPLGTFVVARADAGTEVVVLPGEPARRAIPVFERPGGPPRTLIDRNTIDAVDLSMNLIDFDDPGAPVALRVIAGGPEDDWLVVQTPARPNNSYAWVWRDDFEFANTSKQVRVDLAGEGELHVVDGDEVVFRSPIVHGSDERPTPTGLSYLTGAVGADAIRPVFGYAIVATAGFSETFGTVDSGRGPRTLLHGTNAPELMGRRISSGNIRLPDDRLAELIELVVPGTPFVVFDSSSDGASLEDVLARVPEPAANAEFRPNAENPREPVAGVAPQLWRRCGPSEGQLPLCRSDGQAEFVDAGDHFEHVYATAKPDAGMPFLDANDESDPLRPDRIVPVYDEPDGEPRTLVYENAVDAVEHDYVLRPSTVFGQPLVLSVVKISSDGRWLLVRAPVLPHDHVVWVSADDFELASSTVRIEVDIGYEFLGRQGILSVWDEGQEVMAAKISAGRESRPTAPVSTYVDQLVDGPSLSHGYGPLVISTPTFSEALGTFGGGGLPQQAIHALPADLESHIGTPMSAGSIHVAVETVDRLAELDLVGARVVIFDSSSPSTTMEVVENRPLPAARTEPLDPSTDLEQPIGSFT